MSESEILARIAKIADIIDFGKTRGIEAIELSLGEELLSFLAAEREARKKAQAERDDYIDRWRLAIGEKD